MTKKMIKKSIKYKVKKNLHYLDRYMIYYYF